MSEKKYLDGVSTTRSALGDVTNLVGKRGFSLISKSGVKIGDDHNKDEALQCGKKERRTPENYKNENFQKKIVDCVWQPHLCRQIDSSNGNGKARVPCEIKEQCPPGVRHNANSDTAARSSHDARINTQSSPTRLSDSKEQVETSISTNYGDDLTLDNFDFSKGDDLDCSRLVASQESRSSGLERFVDQKGVGCSTTSMDSIKACTCSFCMKAAYIWSDLHYQDIKGRMAAIKKSQKEASILAQRNSRDNEIGKYGQRSSGKCPKMESDLTDKWRSFFLHVEELFVRESIQLESSLLKLRDLREDCKSDLNPTDGMH